MGKLKIAAQEAKESLSFQDSTEIIIDNILMDENNMPIDVFVDLTREQYEEMIRPYVERSIRLVDRAIENANLTLDDIHYFLLAGNASLTPLVQQMVTEKFGEERILKRKHPKYCVAEGAAIIAKVYHSVRCPECGFANALDADQCKKCGHVLNKLFCPECDTPNDPGAEVCVNCGQALDASGVIEVGGLANISSRHYGIQYQGDEFAIFVRKNDPIPTEDKKSQTFQTRHANQRMLYVPVYGGTDTEAASSNEKQGEAFAILPPNLPSGTEVTISLWLDENEVFELSAALEDGTELDPWIVKGDMDHKAVQTLEVLENEVRQKEGALSAAENKMIEESRERVFDDLKSGDYNSAAQEVEDLRQMLAAINGGGGGGELGDAQGEARQLIQFVEFLIHEYRWLLGSERCRDLQSQADGLKASMKSGDDGKLRRQVEDLKKAIDNLPRVLQLLLGLKMAIGEKVEPVAPTRAIQLKDDLAEAERTLQEDPKKGMLALMKVAEAVSKAIEKIPDTGPKPCPVPGCDGTYAPGIDVKCTNGHNVSLWDTDKLGSSVH
jgi:ribosomal protein L40E